MHFCKRITVENDERNPGALDSIVMDSSTVQLVLLSTTGPYQKYCILASCTVGLPGTSDAIRHGLHRIWFSIEWPPPTECPPPPSETPSSLFMTIICCVLVVQYKAATYVGCIQCLSPLCSITA